MTSDEFRSLVVGKTEFEATSQANTVYKALAHARMAKAKLVEAAQGDIGNTPAGRHPQEPILLAGTTEEQIAVFDRDKPLPFSLEEFKRHIEWRQPYKHGANTRVPAGEFHSNYGSILDKLAVLRNDRRIRFLMKDYADGDPDLTQILAQFIGVREDERDIRIIDISGLPNEVAGPLTAAIARLLFQYKVYQSTNERKIDPSCLSARKLTDTFPIAVKRNTPPRKAPYDGWHAREESTGWGLCLYPNALPTLRRQFYPSAILGLYSVSPIRRIRAT